jgi:hypothetical protein
LLLFRRSPKNNLIRASHGSFHAGVRLAKRFLRKTAAEREVDAGK